MHNSASINGAWGAILRAVAWVRGVFGRRTSDQIIPSCYDVE